MKTFIGVAAVAAVLMPGMGAGAGPAVSSGQSSGSVAAPPGLARLVTTAGSVNVSRGGRGAVAPGILRGGDRVLASAGGELVYGNGCSVAVASNVATYVPAAAPCGGQDGILIRAAYQTDVAPGGGYGADHRRRRRDGAWLLFTAAAGLAFYGLANSGGDGHSVSP